MAEFDAKLFGERLRALRGQQTQEKIGSLAGVPDYVLARYERGETDKPAYQYIITIGTALGYSPNEIAALAGLYTLEGMEDEQFGERRRSLKNLENIFMTLSESEQDTLLDMISLMIEAVNRRRVPKLAEDEATSPLPTWFHRKP